MNHGYGAAVTRRRLLAPVDLTRRIHARSRLVGETDNVAQRDQPFAALASTCALNLLTGAVDLDPSALLLDALPQAGVGNHLRRRLALLGRGQFPTCGMHGRSLMRACAQQHEARQQPPERSWSASRSRLTARRSRHVMTPSQVPSERSSSEYTACSDSEPLRMESSSQAVRRDPARAIALTPRGGAGESSSAQPARACSGPPARTRSRITPAGANQDAVSRPYQRVSRGDGRRCRRRSRSSRAFTASPPRIRARRCMSSIISR